MTNRFHIKVIIATAYTFMLIAFCDVGCTIINNNTCIINRTSSWQPSMGNIVCNESFPICIILCDAVKSCSDNITRNRLSIVCSADSCIINCTASRSCRHTQILTSNANYTQLNIKANNAGRDMHIYTSKELHINVIGKEADFLESVIYSQPTSNIININCDKGEICSDNTIFGGNISKSLTFSCNGLHSDCSNSNIWCPTHSILSSSACNIDCDSCIDSKLYCGMNDTAVIWNGHSSIGIVDKDICAQSERTETNQSVNNTEIILVSTTHKPIANLSQIILQTETVGSKSSTLSNTTMNIMEITSDENFRDSAITINPFLLIAISMSILICMIILSFYGMSWCRNKFTHKNEYDEDNDALGEFVCQINIENDDIHIARKRSTEIIANAINESTATSIKKTVRKRSKDGEVYRLQIPNSNEMKYKQSVNVRQLYHCMDGADIDIDVDDIDEQDLIVK